MLSNNMYDKAKEYFYTTTLYSIDWQNGNIDLILEVVDRDKKIIALKELRLILNLDLKTCKYIIDNAPIVILKNINEEQAQYLQEKFNYIGVNVSSKNNFTD